MNKTLDAEERRLQSLKEKKQAFKCKAKLVQEALKNLDSKPQNKKIVFDDNITEEQSPQMNKKRTALFDNDSYNDNIEDYSENFVDTGKSRGPKEISEKRLKLQLRYGNDQRFILDDRFDDDDENADPEQNQAPEVTDKTELDLKKEKDWQLNLLGDVLGAPMAVKKENTTTSTKKSRMIRYDPTEKEHKEYEICLDQSKTKSKKKAKREHIEEIANEDTSVAPTSNEIYYSVSNKITDSLKEPGKFSLLNTFGKNKDEPSIKQISTSDTKDISTQGKDRKFQFDLHSGRAFKYDSSDDEDNVEEPNNRTQQKEQVYNGNHDTTSFLRRPDTFFFSNNDPRFSDALRFFEPNTVPSEDFTNLRYKLTQIVRAKIRNNARKKQPWNKKRKIQRF